MAKNTYSLNLFYRCNGFRYRPTDVH
jgi:hypothetical protein